MKIATILRSPAPMLALIGAIFIGDAAHAQAWIGQIVGDMMAQQAAAQQEALCMTGTAMPDSEVSETRATAEAAINGYWRAVQAGGSVNVLPFYQNDAKAQWVSGSARLQLAGLTAVRDPLAGTGHTLAAQPTGYIRSGDGKLVRGQWAAYDAGGKLVGTYDAIFRRTAGVWKLSEMTVLPAKDYAEPVVQFCHKPNDVLPYRLASTAQERTYLAKRADKMRAKADKARIDAEKAAQKAAGKSDSATQALAAEKHQRAVDAETKAIAAAEAARNAVTANEQAKADAASWESAKAKAIAALTG